MDDPSEREVTRLLRKLREGDREAESDLIATVYGELRRMASRHLRRERDGHTLQATALVHETYVRLTGNKSTDWRDRVHFFSVASRVMRSILVDYARSRCAEKRGEGYRTIPLDEAVVFSAERAYEMVALNEVLDQLEQHDARAGRIVELRFFAGLSVEETAELLQMSTRTVKRDWKFGKTWLKARLEDLGVHGV